MKFLSGFNSQEIRRLHPYLSKLIRRMKTVETTTEKSLQAEWGRDEDIQPTGNINSAGVIGRVARADHQHLFRFPVAVPPSTPDGTAFFDLSTSAINIYVDNTPTTKVVAGASASDVQPTGTARIGTAPRYSFADHSHPTALLPQNNSQAPVINEIRFSDANQLVRWNGTTWVNFPPQLLESTTLPNVLGVVARSSLTGTTGSRRWYIRGVQEDGSFRAPFVGFATFTASTTPSASSLSTTLGDGYAYFIHDLDRVDIVRPTSGGNTAPTMLPHYVINLPCRIFSTATDSSGHYVRDELWQGVWVLRFYTTTSATTDLQAVLPTIAVPLGIRGGRVLLYLHNPQSFDITTVFGATIRIPTSTGISDINTSDVSVNIPANTTTVVDLGYVDFSPSTTLSHNRSHPITVVIVRKRSQENSNTNSVMCLSVVIVPQRSA
jgi:hypothetical protein